MDRERTLLQTRTGRSVAGATVLLVLVTVAGLVALWPGSSSDDGVELGLKDAVRAAVVSVTPGSCEAYAGPGCRVVAIDVLEGRDEGRRSSLILQANRFSPEVAPGDELRVVRSAAPDVAVDQPATQPYGFVDFERRTPLAALALAFAVLVVALARWQGVRALVGLVASLALVVVFVAPAILDGRPPLLVALVGSLAVVAVTMSLTHGPGLKSQTAMLGTALSLVLIALLGVLAVDAAQITGLSEEGRSLLQLGGPPLSLQGLLLAGLVIGALGVLDDVTISQASTVMALRRVNPGLEFRRLFNEALSVGRDHLGATVNTLVLAYAGASLTSLLAFSDQGVGFGTAVNYEVVASQVVAMLVGSIGLIAAVPITTALAAALAVRLPAETVPDAPHAHAH